MVSRGLTLFETLIYIFVFSILITGTVGVTRILLNTRGRAQATAIVQENINGFFSKIRARVHAANSVSAPMVGVSSTQLTLVMAESSLQPTVISLTGGIVSIQQGTSSSIPLTSNEIQVTSLSFLRLNTTPEQVRVSITGWIAHQTSTIFTLNDTLSIRR